MTIATKKNHTNRMSKANSRKPKGRKAAGKDTPDDPQSIIADLRAKYVASQAAAAARHELQKRIRNLQAAEAVAKAKHKAAKDAVEEAFLELLDDPSPTLFDGVSDSGDGKKATGETAKASTADDGWWREVRLDTLSVSETILKKLDDAGVETMGQLSDYTKDGKTLTLINGIGPAAITKIEEATEEFWKKNKDRVPPPAPEAPKAEVAEEVKEPVAEAKAEGAEGNDDEDDAAKDEEE